MRVTRSRSADHPDPTVAVQSNSIFNNAAEWARFNVVQVREAGGDQATFFNAVIAQVNRSANDAGINVEMASLEAERIAQRITDWTWNKYRPPARPLTDEEKKARRSAGIRAGNTKRGADTLQQVTEAATALYREHGRMPSPAAIAALAGVNRSTVSRSWQSERSGAASKVASGNPC